MPPPDDPVDRSLRVHLRALVLTIIGAGGVALALGATIDVAGAVIASSNLVVESELKKLQHPTGGVVSELLVSEGAHVRAGDVLLRLDPTVTRATLAAVTKDLWELSARRSRLEAERDGADDVSFAADLLAAASDPPVARVVSGERALFHLRKDALAGQKAQLRERIEQLHDEIKGLEGQLVAKRSENKLVGQELGGIRDLWQKQLIPTTRINALEREAARLQGEGGRLEATLAQTRGRIAETELQIIQLDQTRRSDVAKELADIRAKTSELTEKRVTALDQSERVELRAPQTGIVHRLSVHTKGGVIAAGEQILMIVPEADGLAVEARILPRDINQLRLGQEALLRFPTLGREATPELRGTVSRIGADAIKDDRVEQPYYVVRLRLDDPAALSGLNLLPGTPVEAFIRTESRSFLSYLLRPIIEQAQHAFRER
ncbi:HlyD family type I secretion periplasmic adaptor subunit [Bosea sp. BK604]|uniref:HlyD family type I secretion periplasmic adaptor subunit n=1 Tax=Bosea sp. BK604 TaxID=2512180 RepID=UPI001053F0E5|nr:HlyD family type I secretion periplasmic adaptor subunit [Bosea sp. BK604]TCR66361.1 HlyD family secretion protein [Bosea sp. BK604]